MVTRPLSHKPMLVAGALTLAILAVFLLLPNTASALTIGLSSDSPITAQSQPIRFKGHIVLERGELLDSVIFSVEGPVSFSVPLPIPLAEGVMSIFIESQGLSGTVKRHHLSTISGYGYAPSKGAGKLTYELRWTPPALGEYTARLTAKSSGAVVGQITRPFSVVERPRPTEPTGKIEFTGEVQSMSTGGQSTGDWTIQGLRVEVTNHTEIEGPINVGDFVKVEGSLSKEGVVRAEEIKVKDKESHPGLKAGDQHKDKEARRTGPKPMNRNKDDD